MENIEDLIARSTSMTLISGAELKDLLTNNARFGLFVTCSCPIVEVDTTIDYIMYINVSGAMEYIEYDIIHYRPCTKEDLDARRDNDNELTWIMKEQARLSKKIDMIKRFPYVRNDRNQ